MSEVEKNKVIAIGRVSGFHNTQNLYKEKYSASKQFANKLSMLYETAPGKADTLLIEKVVVDADISSPQATAANGYLYRFIVVQDSPGVLVAFPEVYNKSGVVTFANVNGKVLFKDLGNKSDNSSARLTVADFDKSWNEFNE